MSRLASATSKVQFLANERLLGDALGGGFGADLLHEAQLHVEVGPRRLQLARRVHVADAADVDLRHDGHGQRQRAGVEQLVLRADYVALGRVLEDLEQVPARLGAPAHPAIVLQVLVAVVIVGAVNLDAWQQLEQRRVRLMHIDALLVDVLPQFGTIVERYADHLLGVDLEDRRRHMGGVARQRELRFGRQVHQRRQLRLGGAQLALQFLGRALDLDQLALVGQRCHRRVFAAGGQIAGIGQCDLRAAFELGKLLHQPVGADRTPIGRAHVLDDALHDLAPASSAISTRSAACRARTNDRPKSRMFQLKVMSLVFSSRSVDVVRGSVSTPVLRLRSPVAVVVVARGVSGVGDDARQKIVMVEAQLGGAQGGLHHLDLEIEIVFQRARHRLVQRDRARRRALDRR